MKIEIISGSYGWRKTKDAMPKLVERGGICEVDEAEARRLVALGVAAIVHEADEAPVASGSTVESKKDDLIAAIVAVPVEPGEEISEDDLPDLSAAAPVV